MALKQQKQREWTIEDFEAYADSPDNANRLLELVNGEITEKMPTEDHGNAVSNLAVLIGMYLRQHNIKGRLLIEVRYRNPADRRNARIPDISFHTQKHELVTKGSVPHMPGLAIKVKSPDDTLKSMREKARFYLANGTKLVWLVYPNKRLVEVYTADVEDVLIEENTLDGGEVLPGFTLAVHEIFADPLAES